MTSITSQSTSGAGSRRGRILVTNVSSALIFASAIFQLTTHAPWGVEADRTLVAFWQQVVAPKQLSTTVEFSMWSLRFAFFVLCFFLAKLYMSLTVFDVLPEYHEKYVRHIRIVFREIEWSLRLLIFLYLLAGLPGYSVVVGWLRRFAGSASVVIPVGVPGSGEFCDIATYICGLLVVCLLWDTTLVAGCRPGAPDGFRREVLKSFGAAHALGFGVWASFVIIFSNRTLTDNAVIIFPIFALIALGVLIWLTFSNVFGQADLLAKYARAIRVWD